MNSRPRRRRFIPDDRALRLLASSSLINTFGNGLLYTLSALYFTRIVGLSVAQVGLGLTIAGGFGVLAGIPAGHLSDRWGPRPLLLTMIGLEALGTVAYTVIDSFVGFLVVVSLTTVFDRASSAVRSALYAVTMPAESRTQGRAYLRAVTNVGIGAGAAVAAIGLQADTKTAYVALILIDAATFVGAVLPLLRLPLTAPSATPTNEGRRRNRALTDRPYLVMTGLNSVLSLQFGLIEVGLPLWIVGHTQAPRAMVSVILLVNTAFCVLLQVRASRGVTSVRLAARAAFRGGLLLAACCLIFGVADGFSAAAAAVILLIGILVQTCAEVLCSAAGWALSYDLAEPDAPGAYQGVFSSGFALSGMLAPIVATSTALRFGFAGWALLAGVFALAGAALIPVSRWALERRTGQAAPVSVG